METYKYKIVGLLVLMAFSVQAQKFDKKVMETFKVNADAIIEINATHTDVDIETWNKNEVSIEAVIEVEGVSKEEAEKIFDKWKFEALANNSKVEITSVSDNFLFNFDFDFDFPEVNIEIPHFEMPDIDIPDFEFQKLLLPKIEIPDIEIPEIEFDYEMYKNDSTYLKNYKMKVAKQVEKFKNSGWKKKLDSTINSEEFKMQLEEIKKATKQMAKEMEAYKNSDEFKHQLEEAKKISEEVRKEMLENKELWKEQAEAAKMASKKAMELVKKMKEEGKFDAFQKNNENYLNQSDGENSKIKVRKYLKIKVPKNATFDLNVRHGKLNVPNSSVKMSANLSYGKFIGGIITGNKNELIFSNSPVVINTINSGNITLKNVPNAKFGTFSKANLFSNSSDVFIEEIGKDVSLSQKFGKLEISNIEDSFNTLNLILDYAKANLNFSNSNYIYQINSKDSTLQLFDKLTEVKNETIDGVKFIEGFYNNKSSQNKVLITGVYSTVILN